MKNLIVVVLTILLFTSCSKDKTAMIVNGNKGFENADVKFKGAFYPTSGITVNGNAQILFNGSSYSVLLDSFMVSSGPDLKVYLSKQDTPFEFINLGALRSNSENNYYSVTGLIDFSTYRYVLIYCQQYNHLFAIAELKP